MKFSTHVCDVGRVTWDGLAVYKRGDRKDSVARILQHRDRVLSEFGVVITGKKRRKPKAGVKYFSESEEYLVYCVLQKQISDGLIDITKAEYGEEDDSDEDEAFEKTRRTPEGQIIVVDLQSGEMLYLTDEELCLENPICLRSPEELPSYHGSLVPLLDPLKENIEYSASCNSQPTSSQSFYKKKWKNEDEWSFRSFLCNALFWLLFILACVLLAVKTHALSPYSACPIVIVATVICFFVLCQSMATVYRGEKAEAAKCADACNVLISGYNSVSSDSSRPRSPILRCEGDLYRYV